MAKQFLDEDSIATFVMRDIKHSHEPLFCILKIMEALEDGTVVLLNLMTGLAETTTKDLITKDFKMVTGENLHEMFLYVYNTHNYLDLTDETINH